MVTLTATPDPGSSFTGWSGGGCIGTGTCMVTMDQARTVNANFDKVFHVLNVTLSGSCGGRVTSSPVGIDCGSDCGESYPWGTVVTLTATPDPGCLFSGWTGGGCGGTGLCTLTMDQAHLVDASFSTAPVAEDVVINEVFTGNPDYVELYNAGSTSVDLAGWSLEATGCGSSLHVLPSFTLAPGAYVEVIDGSGSDTADTLFLGSNICWNPDEPGSAGLSDPVSGVDFARWGGSTTPPPTGTAWSGTSAAAPPWTAALGRDPASTDTDSAQDWCVQAESAPGPNRGCGLVVINEVFGGTPDYVELYNSGSTPVDLAGWLLETNGCGPSLISLPAFNLAPGGYVRMLDDSGTNTADTIHLGINICWNQGEAGSAGLSDTFAGMDFVRWGGSITAPPAGTGWLGGSAVAATGGFVLGRDSYSTDTDMTADWCEQTGSAPGVNPTCPSFYNLSVTRSGDGTGRVTSDPVGIDCGSDCSEDFVYGSFVTLTASPDPGSVFVGWSGEGCDGVTLPTCTVVMDRDRTIDAHFIRITHTLTVILDGDGSGEVVSSPPGIDCGTDCSEAYPEGEQVTLTATPDAGSSFAGWSGGGCGTANPCTVSMTQLQTVTASFATISTKVLINEIFGGTPDYIELYNAGPQAVDLAGWIVETTGCATDTHILPPFVLAPGAYVEIFDSTGINTGVTIYLGSNICWNQDDTGSAALSDNVSTGMDFVRWGGSTTAPPAGTGWSGGSAIAPADDLALGRDSVSTDTDSRTDWCRQTVSTPTANLACEDMIFSDGFESGDCSNWTSKVP